MTTLHGTPPVALDECAHEFIATFMTHVATLTGYGVNRLTTIAGIKTLLLAAMAHEADDAAIAWSALYRAIDDLVDASIDAHDTRFARSYLRAFMLENGDLANA
jgi:hypothetical protein